MNCPYHAMHTEETRGLSQARNEHVDCPLFFRCEILLILSILSDNSCPSFLDMIYTIYKILDVFHPV